MAEGTATMSFALVSLLLVTLARPSRLLVSLGPKPIWLAQRFTTLRLDDLEVENLSLTLHDTLLSYFATYIRIVVSSWVLNDFFVLS